MKIISFDEQCTKKKRGGCRKIFTSFMEYCWWKSRSLMKSIWVKDNGNGFQNWNCRSRQILIFGLVCHGTLTIIGPFIRRSPFFSYPSSSLFSSASISWSPASYWCLIFFFCLCVSKRWIFWRAVTSLGRKFFLAILKSLAVVVTVCQSVFPPWPVFSISYFEWNLDANLINFCFSLMKHFYSLILLSNW